MNDRLGWVGLVYIVLGTAYQVVANWMPLVALGRLALIKVSNSSIELERQDKEASTEGDGWTQVVAGGSEEVVG